MTLTIFIFAIITLIIVVLFISGKAKEGILLLIGEILLLLLDNMSSIKDYLSGDLNTNDTLNQYRVVVFQDKLADGISLGPEMVWIPAGSFRMGDIQGGGDDNEKPVHEVSLNKFAMGKYEVTFDEYDKFAEATGRSKPDDNGWGRGNRPVINVSWDDATAYTEWLSQETKENYSLPTEAEWEYAARAGTETKYWWGNQVDNNKVNCYDSLCGDNVKYTAPVGSFDANPFGLFDTAGNVWEWTCSEYENQYQGNETKCLTSREKNANKDLSLRGGSWNTREWRVRSAFRINSKSDERKGEVGFRIMRQE